MKAIKAHNITQTENKERNRKIGMLSIMGEYVHLTVQGGDK